MPRETSWHIDPRDERRSGQKSDDQAVWPDCGLRHAPAWRGVALAVLAAVTAVFVALVTEIAGHLIEALKGKDAHS